MRNRHRFNSLILAVAIAFVNAPYAGSVMNSEGMPPSFVGYAPRKIVVKFDHTALGRINRQLTPSGRTGISAVDKLARDLGVVAIKQQFPGAKERVLHGRTFNLAGWHKVHFQKDVDIEKVVAAFKKLSNVVDVQPVGIHAVQLIPNDTVLQSQWHLNQTTDRDIDAPEAWNFETGNPDIIVAVLDTGVHWFHNDLGGSDAVFDDLPGSYDNISDLHGADGNMWINWDEVNGVIGIDDGGNEFEDDMIGWDFVDLPQSVAQDWCNRFEDCTDEDNDPRDFHGHGTHVAGIVGALNNNGSTVSSPAGGWGDGTPQSSGGGVRIMALRVGWTDRNFPWIGYVSMDFAAEALHYAAANNARIVNASWGSSNSGGLGAAADDFIGSGGLIFHAAGNSTSSTADYLGSRDDVVNVAATDNSDCKAGFSNYGDWVDIAAPGVNIISTWNRYIADPFGDYVDWKSGTSMASPVAASVAALIWSQNPLWTAQQVKMKLFDSTDDIDGLDCNLPYLGQLGSGRVNAYLAVGRCEGDFGGNGVVDGRDLAALVDAYSCISGCSPYDVTYDGIVGSGDLDVFVKDFGRTVCPESTAGP